MLDLICPPRIDNTYPGRKPALWLFGFLAGSKLLMGANCTFNGRLVAMTADGIPVDAYAPDAARTVVAFFSVWGVGQLTLGLLGLLALIRYRAMVPLLFAVYLLEHLGRRLIFLVMPVERVGTPMGPAINLGLLVVMVVGLALASWRRGGTQAGA